MADKKEWFTAERREAIITRLNRIEGQIRGIKAMVEKDSACLPILQQVASVYEALRGASRLVMRNYLETRATASIRSGDADAAETVYHDILDMMRNFAR